MGNGETIETSVIIIEDGKITTVGDAKVIRITKEAANYIDISGTHVYPGLILPNTSLGLTEVDAVRASRDLNEVGSYTPNVRSIVAYNTDSKVTATVKTNGILLAQICPDGGVLPGRSSIVELDAWNWEDAAYLKDEGQHLHWPSMMSWQWGEGWVKSDNYADEQAELRSFLSEAKAYCAEKNPKEKDLRFESLRGVFKGTETLYLHAYYGPDMQQAVLFAEEMGIKKFVLVGAIDAVKIADFLVEHDVPVILDRIHSLPRHQDDGVNSKYMVPQQLHEKGVKFCLNYSGDMERMGSRNLPFLAGTAAAYGMDKEEALSLVTLRAAEILGIDAFVGSLETGKDATLVISTGDLLDMRTNEVVKAFIRGREIDLGNHQKDLWQKYVKKYGIGEE